MSPVDSEKPSSILLGRPFLNTSSNKASSGGSFTSPVDIIDEVMEEVHKETLGTMSFDKSLSMGEVVDFDEDIPPPLIYQEDNKPHHAPSEELKLLPSYLKYAFLEDGNKLPVIIAKESSPPNKKKSFLEC
ncbi:hypothetical protein PIB30_072703 [Stylosanthes scabra]|uniref:Reverse transcriptase domain-containing protein n=1 Tax=Stylosanthes scabra TaxID=79078 RepID=A0ABU6UMY7_9FABA|nr:hypothetical protein [Stylosanthes scabra]